MLTAQTSARRMKVLLATALAERGQACLEALRAQGFTNLVTVTSAQELLDALARHLAARTPVDLVCLDLHLPGCAGLQAFEDLRAVYDTPVLLLGEHSDEYLLRRGLAVGAGDSCFFGVPPELWVGKVERLLLRRLLNVEVRAAAEKSESLFLNSLTMTARVAESKDASARNHSENVSSLATWLAQALGLDEEETRQIGIAGMLHDIGKLGVAEHILTKPGPLTPDERESVRRHPEIGATMLEPIERLRPALQYVRHHHERFDGAGYPDRLAGESIPLGARIIHVAEAYDAMTTPRPYSKPRTPARALVELRAHAGTQFDARVVETLVVVLNQRGMIRKRATAIDAESSQSAKSFQEVLLQLRQEDAQPRPSAGKEDPSHPRAPEKEGQGKSLP